MTDEKPQSDHFDLIVNVCFWGGLALLIWYVGIREPTPKPSPTPPSSYTSPFGGGQPSSPPPAYRAPPFTPEPAFGERYKRRQLEERIEDLERKAKQRR